jgi:hypothetical protein
VGIGHRLGGGEGLGGDDEQRGLGVDTAQYIRQRTRVDVGDEMRTRAVALPPQRTTDHARTEIGAADADVDDIANGAAGGPTEAPAAHVARIALDARTHFAHARHHILAVDPETIVRRGAQRHVQRRATLGVIDRLAGEHARDPLARVPRAGQRQQLAHRGIVESLARPVERDAGRREPAARRASRIGGEEPGQIQIPGGARAFAQRSPGRAFGQR